MKFTIFTLFLILVLKYSLISQPIKLEPISENFMLNQNGKDFQTTNPLLNKNPYNFDETTELVSGNINTIKSDTLIKRDFCTIGFGAGLDYGGFGGNLTYFVLPQLGVFAGIGYPLIDVGYNIGLKFRFLSKNTKKEFTPFLLTMYGYSTVIKIKGAKEYNKMFYSTSIGFGFDYQTRDKGYWTFSLLVPFRGNKVDDYIKYLETNHRIEFENKPLPIGISAGYRIIII